MRWERVHGYLNTCSSTFNDPLVIDFLPCSKPAVESTGTYTTIKETASSHFIVFLKAAISTLSSDLEQSPNNCKTVYFAYIVFNFSYASSYITV